MAGSGVQYSKLGDLREGLAEAARTDELNAARTVERFVELSPGHEGTLRARQHHLLSGRRGTGKSTLLHVVRAHLRESEVPVAVVDMEKFKNRPFPDVLVEILITLLDELRPPVRLKTFFRDLGLRRRFKASHRELTAMLRDPQSWSKELRRSSNKSSGLAAKVSLEGGAAGGGVAAKGTLSSSGSKEAASSVVESAAYEELKIERLQQLASRLSEEFSALISDSDADRAVIFIDDFYYVRLEDQPQVLDYLKSVAKGTGIWLKVGGVGERMRTFRDGDPAVGMQLNQDIFPLAIDITLDDFGTAQRFLERMMDGILKDFNLSTAQLFTETARSRMVLACGGAVARDYITLTSGALDAAVERLNRAGAPEPQSLVNIQAEDVNAAASKRMNKKEEEELSLDAGEDATRLRVRWRDVCDFVREIDSAFVLVRQKDLDETQWGADIRQLENLRLLHRIRDTKPNAPNWRGVKCVVFMVDLGQLTVKRLQKAIPRFWENTQEFDKLRRAEWVYAPDWEAKLSSPKPSRTAAPQGEAPASGSDASSDEGTLSLFDE
ncbi:hypothetical protein H7J51_06970 [Mycobacterium crocinum]|uniref:Uncharacterized protein n=1 Tax=Mycolicibacterium crocinum TaxID=388459 RepID=A0ABY3TN06_9MYCO|nr:hypothetical protein [Mycolicibacterium crocinum]MCV7215023.1 hypothetical protein [Mycolicibacterium crocinum]ULN42087.1 hypothetical protein MI149_02865 [Mycolicibacterium crocinum]